MRGMSHAKFGEDGHDCLYYESNFRLIAFRIKNPSQSCSNEKDRDSPKSARLDEVSEARQCCYIGNDTTGREPVNPVFRGLIRRNKLKLVGAVPS